MAKRKATSKGPVEVDPVLELIVAMTDQFCREKLNEEYAVLCRRLAEKLARKRPSPCSAASRRPGPVGSFAQLVGSTFLTTAVTSRT